MPRAPNDLTSPLFRILPFNRAVQLFVTRELHFSHPSSWDDPFETRVRHSKANNVFAQCWCKKGVSDAMWRIYSPDRLSVRVRTSRKSLQTALSTASSVAGFKMKIQNVRYLPESKLSYEQEAIADELAQTFSHRTALEPLFMKRLAFRHEEEVRAVIHLNGTPPNDVSKGFKVSVDPHALVETILVDPRAPDEFVQAYQHYFRDKLGFVGRIAKSALYADREPIEVL